jgi:WD40 repeat protein
MGLFDRSAGNSTQAAYTLRPNEDPKAIDLTYLNGPKKDKLWKRGIYSRERGNNQLKICWGDEERRPTEFATKPDSKLVLNVFFPLSLGGPLIEKPPEKWKLRSDLDTKHEQAVTSLAFSPDGKLLATGSLDKTVKLWEATSGKEIGMLRTSGPLPVTHVEFSPEGRLLAAIETDVDEKRAGRVSVWDAKTRKLQFYTPSQGGQINSMAFSPDGRLLATAGLDKMVWLFDASRAGKLVRQLIGHKSNINSVRFSPDGKILASASSDGTVRLWDPANGREVRRLQVNGGPEGVAHRTGGVRSVRFTSDGKWIVTVGEDALNLWETVSSKQILEWYGLNGGVVIAEVSPDGKTLAVTERKAEQTLVLLDIALMEKLASLTGQIHPVKSVAFSPNGNTLAIAGDGTHVKLWTREVPQRDAK